MSLYNVSLIKGFMVGIEYEHLEGDDYLIINLGFIQFIFVDD